MISFQILQWRMSLNTRIMDLFSLFDWRRHRRRLATDYYCSMAVNFCGGSFGHACLNRLSFFFIQAAAASWRSIRLDEKRCEMRKAALFCQ